MIIVAPGQPFFFGSEFGAPGWRTIFQFYETWATSPMRALENSFDNSHFSFVHRATFGVPDAPQPSKYELIENDTGFYAETVIAAANPEKFHRISGVQDAVTTRHSSATKAPTMARGLRPLSSAYFSIARTKRSR